MMDKIQTKLFVCFCLAVALLTVLGLALVTYKIQSLTGVRYSNWNGKRTNNAKYYGKYVRIIQVINYAKYFRINFIRNGKAYYADSRDKTLFYSIHRLNHFPINFKITKYDWRIYTKNRKENIKPQI